MDDTLVIQWTIIGVGGGLAVLVVAAAWAVVRLIKAEMRAEISELRAEMNTNDSSLRADMNANDAQLRADMNANDAQLRADMNAMNERQGRTLRGDMAVAGGYCQRRAVAGGYECTCFPAGNRDLRPATADCRHPADAGALCSTSSRRRRIAPGAPYGLPGPTRWKCEQWRG